MIPTETEIYRDILAAQKSFNLVIEKLLIPTKSQQGHLQFVHGFNLVIEKLLIPTITMVVGVAKYTVSIS